MGKYEEIRAMAHSALQELAKKSPDFDQARMLVGAADVEASLKRQTIRKTIDTEWITRVEAALPALDTIIRTPPVFIEDEEEVVPVELTRRISEKSIKHLAQHTNFILKIEGDEITPSRILNVFHEESYLTYENKFVNTLLVRLAAFVDKRFRALVGGSGIEEDYRFDYGVDFEHFAENDKRTTAKINLHIELTSPLEDAENEIDADINAQFASAIERISRINAAIAAYLSSPFAQKLGRNFIRPPVIRTNAILKNKNFKDCLTLWEFIEGYEKTGFSVLGEEFAQMPHDDYVSDLYGLLALQYTQFYHGIVGRDVKLLAEKRLAETFPDFDLDLTEQELEDYLVYDSEYKKTVPVSRLMNNRKKLSEDEKRVREAIEVALRADEILNAELLRAEEEQRRLERERLKKEEEERARKAAMEAAARRGPIEIRYKRSFLSRYIQAGEELQGYYGAIKNALLSYERVSARTSWKCESFRRGRATLARVNVMGKSIYLYLALSPADYEGKNHVSDASKKMADTPLLVKVKSERSLKRALALIAEMMQKSDIAKFERAPEDYTMPYESTEALLERGLVKMILPAGVTLNEYDQTVRADIPGLIGERKVEEKAEEPAAELPAEEVAEVEAEEILPIPQQIEVRYRRSFLSRYIQAGEELQGYYGAIKNALLSYERVSARTSWKCESFRRGRAKLARINVMGKAIYLYLALNPADYEGKNNITDASGKMADTPVLVKVKSERSLKRALSLIAEMMQKSDIAKFERAPEDYTMPYESTEELLARGLVKMILPAGVTLNEYDRTVRADIPGLIGERKAEEKAEEPAAELLAEEVAEVEAEEILPIPQQIEVRYRRSFLSRYIQAGEELQGYYGAIKNELLSYRRVSARTSWKCETYKQGRAMLARINVMGKSIYLYLALSPADYEGKNNITDASGKMADTPVLVKVKSERSLKRALSLIAEMMQKSDIAKFERAPEDYTMPYESTEELLARGLVKMILPAGVTLNEYDQTVRADIPGLIGERRTEEAVQAPVEGPTFELPTEEIAEEAAEEPAAELLAEEVAEVEAEEILPIPQQIEVRYRRSFLSRYIQAGEELQGYYGAIKNELLSYRRVSARTSWKCETYKQGRAMLARINVMGKAIYLYLALNPADYEGKNNITDASGKMADTPVLVKVKSERSLKRALALIAEMMQKSDIAKFERAPEDYTMPYESTEELLARGLVKMILPAGVTLEEHHQPVQADLFTLLSKGATSVVEEAAVAQDLEESPITVSENAEEPIAAPEPIPIAQTPLYTVMDLTQLDFQDADFVHPVSMQMIDKVGGSLQAVLMGEQHFVSRTYRRLALAHIPRAARKAMRLRERNFIFQGEQKAHGLRVPYTREQYRALSSWDKKLVMQHVARIQEYDRMRAQLAALRILKTDELRAIEKMQKLEARLAAHVSTLPTGAMWKDWIKE